MHGVIFFICKTQKWLIIVYYQFPGKQVAEVSQGTVPTCSRKKLPIELLSPSACWLQCADQTGYTKYPKSTTIQRETEDDLVTGDSKRIKRPLQCMDAPIPSRACCSRFWAAVFVEKRSISRSEHLSTRCEISVKMWTSTYCLWNEKRESLLFFSDIFTFWSFLSFPFPFWSVPLK